MPTPTRTEVRSTHLRAYAVPDRARSTRLTLVPDRAILLADDQVSVSVRVAANECLRIIEPGGTVAYHMRGRQARWDVDIEVEPGGHLTWLGEPFVVSEGADVQLDLSLQVAGDAHVALRETYILGRTGERPGSLRTRSRVVRDNLPLLVETMDASVGLGPARVLDQLLLVGPDRGEPRTVGGEDWMVLETGDRMCRWLGDVLHASPLGATAKRLGTCPDEAHRRDANVVRRITQVP